MFRLPIELAISEIAGVLNLSVSGIALFSAMSADVIYVEDKLSTLKNISVSSSPNIVVLIVVMRLVSNPLNPSKA